MMERNFLNAAGSIRHTLRSDALLFITSAIWGLGFAAQRKGMEYIGPYLYNGMRFALGFLALVLLAFFRLGRSGRAESEGPLVKTAKAGDFPGIFPHIGAGIFAGLMLTFGASFQQVGIQFTTAGKAGFITGLYVVLVPILGILIKQHTGRGTWTGAVLAVIGIYLISGTGKLGMGKGDLLVLASSFFYACHVLTIAHFAKRFKVIMLSAIQFACCSLLSMAVALFTEPIEIAMVERALIPILYGGLGSVGIAFTLQMAAQRHAPASHSAIILSLETVFAVLGGMIFLSERMSPKGYMGCALMLAGMLASQWDIISSRSPKAAPGGGK